MKDIFNRCVSGILFAVFVIAGTMLHPIVFLVVFLFLLVVTQLEFYSLVKKGNYQPQIITGIIAGMATFLMFFGIGIQWFHPRILAGVALFPVLIFAIETMNNNNGLMKNALVTAGGYFYIAIPFGLLNFIVFTDFLSSPKFAPQTLLGIFFIIWIYDSMAYVFGSLLGKHKILEKISPQKSWEGVIGGGVFAIIMGILNAVIFQTQSMLSWIIISIIIIVFGTTGDFFESKFKRECRVKDTGNILPGHGGLLDRFDGFLFAIPLIFLWLTIQNIL